MLKKALRKCDYIIKQPALKIHSTKAEESRNIQTRWLTMLKIAIKKMLNKYSLTIFSKIKNVDRTLLTKMVETWVTGKFHPSIFHHG